MGADHLKIARRLQRGERAVQWVEKYLTEVRPRLCLDTRTQAVFLSGYGGPFNPDVLSRMISALMEKAGLTGKGAVDRARLIEPEEEFVTG